LKSKCFAQSEIAAEDFNPSTYIEKKLLRFRPDKNLKKAFRQAATFRRISSDLMA
jgi:hypothetical protein